MGIPCGPTRLRGRLIGCNCAGWDAHVIDIRRLRVWCLRARIQAQLKPTSSERMRPPHGCFAVCPLLVILYARRTDPTSTDTAPWEGHTFRFYDKGFKAQMKEELARLRVSEVPTVRAIVEQKIRDAIMLGTFKPGQRLVERELCELIGVSRPSIREALRRLEADGLINNVPNRGPAVNSISTEEAQQLYAARALLEGYLAREC